MTDTPKIISDKRLNELIEYMKFQQFDAAINALLELKQRRETERKDPLSQALNEGDGVYRP